MQGWAIVLSSLFCIWRKTTMRNTVTFNTPALFGDHHVLEVRRMLLDLPGVEDVYASSAFRVVDVTYDTDKNSEEAISQVLSSIGYLGEWLQPEEKGVAAETVAERKDTYFRHTEVFETSRQVVSFTQRVSFSGRPLWNCPGLGVINNKMEE
jgi:copper chaperone CopZ